MCMLFKVNEYDELSDCVTVDRRSYYEEKHRAFIGSQIDKLNEEGNIPIVNFEEFINNINMLLTLEELGINTEGFEEKKQVGILLNLLILWREVAYDRLIFTFYLLHNIWYKV